ncbi:hypothetical protein MINT15_26740 [Saccharomonospora viridis]|uniref:Uncharacterized protein n=1 Tax=Saccharomonospora viridis TaxID=1852 RepID=A0A837D4L0_9PSEU|nr:hypothetical protein MINT15_26740 [Saccharomonospora viridis]
MRRASTEKSGCSDRCYALLSLRSFRIGNTQEIGVFDAAKAHVMTKSCREPCRESSCRVQPLSPQ